MSKTIIISNRLPLQLQIENKTVHATPSVGGLATGMKSVHKDSNGVWIGWTGLTEEEIPANLLDDVIEATIKEQCIPVSLTKEDIDDSITVSPTALSGLYSIILWNLRNLKKKVGRVMLL